MSKIVKIVVGAVLIVAGVITGNPYLILQGVLLEASALLTPGTPQRQAQATTIQLGEVPRQALFGEVLTAGSLADVFNHGGKYGTDWEVLVIIIADHYCEQLVGFYANDEFVSFTAVGDDAGDHDGVISGYNSQLRVNWYPGTETQIVKQTLIDFGGWSSNDKLAGVAHVVVHYKADKSDAKDPVWPSGRPHFTFLVRGKRCYDPRLDSTVAGGSGTHRWATPSTWAWTNNPVICRYNWVRGVYACDRVDQPDQLLVGRGLSAIEAPPENSFWRANLCDETVALAVGGSEPRYTIGTIVHSIDQFGETEDLFAAACAGVITQPAGSVEMDPGAAKTPVAYITDADLLVGSTVSFSAIRSDADEQWCNTVIPRYVEPTQKWADHGAPIRRNYADVISDGGPREVTLSLQAVNSGTQAQRVAEIRRRMGRLPRTATITLGPRFAALEEGDWIVWTSARHTDGVPVIFRVEAFGLDQQWQITLSLRAINSEVFDWTTADEIAPGAVAEATTPPDGYGIPDDTAWSIAGASIGADGATLPGLVFTGAVEDIYVSAVRFEYREHVDGAGDGDNWIGPDLASPNVTTRTITSVKSGVSYDGAVSYSFPGGKFGDRLILGPVDAGDLATANNVSLTIRNAYLAPVSCTATDAGSSVTITVPNQTWDYPVGTADVTRTGASLTGYAYSTRYYISFDDSTLANTTPTYIVSTTFLTSINSTSNPYRHYIGFVDTPAAGGGTTTGGGGGGGYGCTTVESLILMANAAHDGPGDWTPAGEVRVGDWVWTRHEHDPDGRWDAYTVEAIRFLERDILSLAGHPDATPEHPFWHGAWILMETIGTPAGRAMIAHMTIADAHTYVARHPGAAEGVLSHNKMAEDPDA